MSNVNLTALAVEASRSSTTTEVPIWLLELSHPDFSTLRFASYEEDLVATSQVSNDSQVYSGVGLEASLPDDVGEAQPDMTIRLHDSSQTIVQALRSVDIMTSARVLVTAWLVFLSDPNVRQRGRFSWNLVGSSWDEQDVVQLTLKQENLVREQFPRHRFTPSKFPALFR